MNGTIDELLIQDIRKVLAQSPLPEELIHSELTLEWLLELKPDADEALRVAAIAHDIERGVTGASEKDVKDYSKILDYKKAHAMRSADIVAGILERHDYEAGFIEKVHELVAAHEDGGGDATVLMEADSIAYFDYNITHYHGRYGDEQTKGKVEFMYGRLSRPARDMVRDISYETDKIRDLVLEVTAKVDQEDS